MPKFFTATDDTQIAYDDTLTGGQRGAELHLLCLAGLTRSMSDFDYLLPHLAQADLPPIRLIRMDYRGRGASQWRGADTYTVPREAKDALELLDHLALPSAAVIGTSRGGIIGLLLAITAKHRLKGLLLNDVGPVLNRPGLERILDYLGRNPVWKTHAEAAAAMGRALPGFPGVPTARWLAEAQKFYTETESGLQITYDPALREAFIAAFDGPEVDLWPFFDAAADLPIALLRGANSDLLSPATLQEMRRRRPDLIFAEVPDRAHIPFLDEPASLAVISKFLKACQ